MIYKETLKIQKILNPKNLCHVKTIIDCILKTFHNIYIYIKKQNDRNQICSILATTDPSQFVYNHMDMIERYVQRR